MSNDFLGTFAKAYMFADMLTPPKQAQVFHTGIDESDLANAVDARTREANQRIRKANATIQALNTENKQLRETMSITRERILEAAREQEHFLRERAEYTAELEVTARLLREELARVDDEKAELERRLNALENSSGLSTNVDIKDSRETVLNGR
ncbi:hypothetical protein E0J20_09205 [Rhizobium leguminosarum bv. viciae]|nr:hypothetical protein E0J20_09205 [Rhizobium leguminosarum bv. viciae]